MSFVMEKINDDQLEQVAGGLYGGSSGHWVPATVTAPAGLFSYSREAGNFIRSGQFIIPFGEDIPVDMNRKAKNYAVAFYNEIEAWIDLSGVELI